MPDLPQPNASSQPAREWVIRVPIDLIKRNIPRVLVCGLLIFLIQYYTKNIFASCPRYIQQEVLAPELRGEGLNFVARQVRFSCTLAGHGASLKLVRFVDGVESDVTEIKSSGSIFPDFDFRWVSPRELRVCSSDSIDNKEGIVVETRQWHEIKVTFRLNMFAMTKLNFHKACYSDS
jgi:hypothetical protein